MSSRPAIFYVFRLALSVASCLLLSGCAARPASTTTPLAGLATGSCSLELSGNTDNYKAIWALISAESKYVVSQDIDRLMRLWSEDASITDARHTPDDPSDDQSVQGQDAIRYRYTRFVFPSAPSFAEAAGLDIHISDNQAEVTSSTHIGNQLTPGGNRWRLVRVNGCWVLQELVYNLTPTGGTLLPAR